MDDAGTSARVRVAGIMVAWCATRGTFDDDGVCRLFCHTMQSINAQKQRASDYGNGGGVRCWSVVWTKVETTVAAAAGWCMVLGGEEGKLLWGNE